MTLAYFFSDFFCTLNIPAQLLAIFSLNSRLVLSLITWIALLSRTYPRLLGHPIVLLILRLSMLRVFRSTVQKFIPRSGQEEIPIGYRSVIF